MYDRLAFTSSSSSSDSGAERKDKKKRLKKQQKDRSLSHGSNKAILPTKRGLEEKLGELRPFRDPAHQR